MIKRGIVQFKCCKFFVIYWEKHTMSIVRLGKTYQVCATCALWNGPRQVEESGITFNNRNSGTCSGTSFENWKMGATSTCLHWTPLAEPAIQGIPAHV